MSMTTEELNKFLQESSIQISQDMLKECDVMPIKDMRPELVKFADKSIREFVNSILLYTVNIDEAYSDPILFEQLKEALINCVDLYDNNTGKLVSPFQTLTEHFLMDCYLKATIFVDADSVEYVTLLTGVLSSNLYDSEDCNVRYKCAESKANLYKQSKVNLLVDDRIKDAKDMPDVINILRDTLDANRLINHLYEHLLEADKLARKYKQENK